MTITPTSPEIDLSRINGLTTKIISNMTLAEMRCALYINALTRSENPWEALYASHAAFDWIVTGRRVEADEDAFELEHMEPVGSA